MGSSDPKLSSEYNARTSEDVTISSAGVIRGIEEVDEGNGWIVVGGEETDARDTISSSYSHMVESEFREYQALGNQQDSMTENVEEVGQTCASNQSSYFHIGPPVSEEAQNNLEV